MLLVYNIAIRLYYVIVWVVVRWNNKAAAWVKGRKEVFAKLEKGIQPADKLIWFHCSSAGEFEQGKPVIEALKQHYPAHKILVTFFSPSGYSVATNYKPADLITYLPLDTKANAHRFLQLVKPQLAVFVKYEFWHHHLHALAAGGVPTILISAAFRKDQMFFKGYGRFFLNMLQCFTQIFVQTEFSEQLLRQHGIKNVNTVGDTRFDRVSQITGSFEALPLIESFVGNSTVVVAGSTWQDDEKILGEVWKDASFNNSKLIIAPHQINASHINEILTLFPGAVRYSTLRSTSVKASGNVLIIDNIGMLSRLYKYAVVTYVGGGFTKDGIHNILEAAVWEKPVVFGPNYHKYKEAEGLIAAGGGYSICSSAQLKQLAGDLLLNEEQQQAVGKCASAFVQQHTGATQKIINYIQENRLLTKL